jgi:hypothetical protein
VKKDKEIPGGSISKKIRWHLAAGSGSFTNLSPEDILPPPKVSPYKEELEEAEQKAKKSEATRCLIWKRLLNETQGQRPIVQHDFHSPQRPQMKVKNRIKVTSVSTVVMFTQNLLKDGSNVRFA